ncbi:MAG: creatininase family protein [Alphaproteobacteria bacterium]
MTLSSRRLELLTQPEVAAQLANNPLIILPAGSVEQHGPHLPAGTDIFAANIIAERVAEKMDGLVIPGGPLGVTPFHMPYEATITLSHETYIRVVYETCQSLAQHGAKQLILINWHEGNSSSLAIAAERLHRECGLSVLTVQACYVAAELYGPTSGGLTHGGEIETLAILAAYPELVHLDRIEGSSDHQHGSKMDKLRRTRSYQPVLTDIRTIAPTGWYGDPSHATIEKGTQMLEDLGAAIASEATEIFSLLEKVNGGIATLDKMLKKG